MSRYRTYVNDEFAIDTNECFGELKMLLSLLNFMTIYKKKTILVKNWLKIKIMII